MSYEKTTWQAGDTITSEKLNHLEGGVAAIRSGGAVPEVEVLNDLFSTPIGRTSTQLATFTPVDVTAFAGRSVKLVLSDELNADGMILHQSISETSAIESTMEIRTRSTWGDVDYPSSGGVTLTVDFASGACYVQCYADAMTAVISHIEVVITEAVVPALAEYVAKRYVANVSKSTGVSVKATISQLLQDVQAGYDVVIRAFYEDSTTYFEDYRLAKGELVDGNISFVGAGHVLNGVTAHDTDEWSMNEV